MLSKLDKIVAFRTVTATVLTVLVYLAVFIVAEWQDAPRPAPNNSGDVDLSQAFQDLKFIATGPHPYNSHRNDVVRDYILARVQEVAAKSSHVTVVDDLVSNATYASTKDSVYHESLNILVAVEGTSPNLEGVLFSAHFDSVSTAGGATDDGMGVATLLQLIEYFAVHPPKRNAVFNINNGEEDWLNGAHVFLEHPLSRNLKTFLNLEGAGSGGRPMLFRSSNTRVTRLFKASPHPHGNTISADGFKRGLIKSGTDYSVYEQAGMRGLDFAFYRNRNQYHTKYDTVANLDGKAPLWNMLEASLATAKALTEEKETSEGDSNALYFDVLGEGFVVVSLRLAFILNIVFLTLGPIAALVLGIFAGRAKKVYWSWRGWIRFPLALVLAVGLEYLLVFGYSKINPYNTYSSPRVVVLSFATLTALAFYSIMKTFAYFFPISSQRHIVLIEYYVFWWILLVLNTVAINKHKLGSLFPVAFFHAGALLSLLIGLLEVLLFKPRTPNADLPTDPDDPNVETALVVERAEPPSTDEADEQTPLLVTRRKVVGLKSEIYDEKQTGGMWLWQYIVAVPFPVLFISQIAWVLLFGLNGTLADGGSPLLLLNASALVGFLMVVPLAPFIHKIHWILITVLGLAFIASTLYNFLSFPFSQDDPLKVYFKQVVDLDAGTNRVYLEGVEKYLRHGIIDEIPSATSNGNAVWCSDNGIRPGLRSCRWAGLDPHVVDQKTPLSKLFTSSAKRVNSTVARFTVQGQNTRACRIYFDSSRAHGVHVLGASNNGTLQQGYEISEAGVSVVKLWSRTWDREWVVDVDLGQNATASERVEGRVACEWSENIDGRIPALEEVTTFIPKWAAVTKADDGLVEAFRKFSI